MTTTRSELLRLIGELSEEGDELRFGQLVANLATLAQGASVEAIWEAEDEELVEAARRLLAHVLGRYGHCWPRLIVWLSAGTQNARPADEPNDQVQQPAGLEGRQTPQRRPAPPRRPQAVPPEPRGELLSRKRQTGKLFRARS